jgi:hypothetical protein
MKNERQTVNFIGHIAPGSPMNGAGISFGKGAK